MSCNTIEKIMGRFLWRGSQPDEARGTALVAWSTVCRPVTQGRLDIRDLQHTNMAFLTKWVCRMMQPSGDLATVVLREVRIFARLGGVATQHLCRAFGRVSRRCRGSSSRSWGLGKPSGSGLITGRDTADWIGFSLVSTLYPRIKGFWCGVLGVTLGSRPCSRHCLTSGWLSWLAYRTSW